jgi:hypothetical protein
MKPKYPHIRVTLTGTDGNAFAVIGKVRTALKRAQLPSWEIQSFTDEAQSGDYDNVLRTCIRWVDID